MPAPFENNGGDDNAKFYDAYVHKFISCPISIIDEFAEYLGMDRLAFIEDYSDKLGGDFGTAVQKNDIMETINPYQSLLNTTFQTKW